MASSEGIELELVNKPIIHQDWWFSSNPWHAGGTMPQSDEGCDEHNLLHEQTEST
jgi:hypothetical protein